MTWSQPTYEAVARLVGVRTGLAFAPSRCDSVEMGIRRAMARASVSDLVRYRDLLVTDADALDDLIVELTVGETYFFREPAQFRFIRTEVLPEIRRRRGAEHVVRVWSAACASGEEAYSLAILFSQEGLARQAHILGTDISRAALKRARQATYTGWSLRGEGVADVQPYLTRQGNLYLLNEQVQRLVAFEYLNLALDVYPSFATGTWGMDLILCRNVLIYFDPDTVQGVARRLFDSLADGGWLITASSDPPLADKAPFEAVVTDHGVFYRRRAGAPLPPPPAPAPAFSLSPSLPEPAPNWFEKEEQEKEKEQEQAPEEKQDAGGRLAPVELLDKTPALADAGGDARELFVRGDYAGAARLTRDLLADAGLAALHVRALANLDPAQAEQACAEVRTRHPFCAELYYLHAVLLLDLGRDADAAQAARRVIYLDRTLAIAHFTLGSILRRLGDQAGARRAYRNARDLCVACPPAQVVPLAEGEPAGRLAEAADAELALLDAPPR